MMFTGYKAQPTVPKHQRTAWSVEIYRVYCAKIGAEKKDERKKVTKKIQSINITDFDLISRRPVSAGLACSL